MENGYERSISYVYSESGNELIFDQESHGRNVKIDAEGKVAQKLKKGAKEALVVTNRPLMDNELFEVEIGDGGPGFKGVKGEMKSRLKGKELVRIGVTVHSPSEVAAMNAQHSMKRMNSGTWMMMSESIIESGITTQCLNRYSLKEITIGDRVAIVRVPEFNGSLMIYINGAPIGIIATGVPDRVYGFAEMQPDCDRICLTQARNVQNEALPLEIRSMREREKEIKKLQKTLKDKQEKVEELESQVEEFRKIIMIMKANHQNSIRSGNGKGNVGNGVNAGAGSPAMSPVNDNMINSPAASPHANGVCRASKSPSPAVRGGNTKTTCCSCTIL